MTGVVGQPMTIAGWAKQAIVNGNPNKFGYLGQYFEKAFLVDTNGAITANETGILSPYGEFLPTQPGAVALVTMTNWGGGDPGTGIVHVISLSTDANHDGVIDSTFPGTDSTSPHHPFRFWVNDSTDSGDYGGDGIPGQTKAPNGQDSQVNGKRDLVNFFPVSLNIRDLLRALPAYPTACWLKQADSALNYIDPSWYDNAALGLTNCLAYLTNLDIAGGIGRVSLPSAPTYQITRDGTILDSAFVARTRDQGAGILLVEARACTTNPLVLEVRVGTNVIATAQLYLSITGVEQMFRHKNLIAETFPNTNSLGAPADRLTDSQVPNEPDTNDKNFVFLHGYNVDPDYARGAFSDVFKRLYWSGSHAKFYGVTWKGNESQWPVGITPNYHTNVVNAFLTAPKLANFLGSLTNGPTVVAAHSLGNMVALSALSDCNARMDKYFMIDAAVPLEAIDGDSAPVNANMIHPDRNNYVTGLYASEWFRLFESGDARNQLTWSNRLANLPITNIYNFYSSGEEVLREDPNGAPPTDLLSSIPQQIVSYLQGAAGRYAWAWQEKDKGRCPGNGFVGSNHGGWGFNPTYDTNFWYQDGYVTNHMALDQAAALLPEQLRTNAFFNTNAPDTALFGLNGAQHAEASRNRILADAIPAITLPVGANFVSRLGAGRNSNMPDEFRNGWPAERTSTEELRWHHSDFRQVAYTFVFRLYDEIVNDGNLR